MTAIAIENSSARFGKREANAEQAKATAELVRVNLGLSPKAYRRLEAIRERTDASSNAEVVRNALRLYDYVIEQTESGSMLCIKTQDDKIIECKLFIE